jgi:hypothetical protein
MTTYFMDFIDDEAQAYLRRASSINSTPKGAPNADRLQINKNLSMKRFIACQNIERYVEKLKIENDPLKRETLINLLTEEEAELESLSKGNVHIRCSPDAPPFSDLRRVA